MFGGFNALQIILASGFTKVTDLGELPSAVLQLAALPAPVSLVRVNEKFNFHLAEKAISDAVRADTTIYPWLVSTIPGVITSPDLFIPGRESRSFLVAKRVAAHEKYPELDALILPIKFVPNPPAPLPELWLSTAIVLNAKSMMKFSKKCIPLQQA